MSRIQVQINNDAVDRASKMLAGIPNGIETATRRAMGRASDYLRSHSVQAIRKQYDISAANLRAEENVHVKYNYQNGVSVEITFAGRKIPLYRYGGAAPKFPMVDRSRRVTAMLNGHWRSVYPSVEAAGHQLKSTSPTKFSDAFVARMQSGHIGIFERTGGSTSKGGDAIREIMGSSVPQMLGNPLVAEKLSAETAAKFEERLDHEITVLLNGWGDRT